MSDLGHDPSTCARAKSYGTDPSTENHRLARADFIESTAKSISYKPLFETTDKEIQIQENQLRTSLEGAFKLRTRGKIAAKIIELQRQYVESQGWSIVCPAQEREFYDRDHDHLAKMDMTFGHSDNLHSCTTTAVQANDLLLPIVHKQGDSTGRDACHERARVLTRFSDTVLSSRDKGDKAEWLSRMSAFTSPLQDILWYTVFPSDAPSGTDLAGLQTQCDEALSKLTSAMDAFDKEAAIKKLWAAVPQKPAIDDVPLWGGRNTSV